MIYTVTLNPALDYVVDVPGFQEGTVNRSERDIKYPGGKGINVSRVLKRLGVPSTALGFTGGFTGDYIKDMLQQEDISTDFTAVDGDTRINVKLRGSGETEVNGVSPEVRQSDRKAFEDKLKPLTAEDEVVIAGSLPASLPAGCYEELMNTLKNQHVRVYLDTSGEPLKKAVQAAPFFIKPNHNELGELYGVTIEKPEDAVYYGRKLMEEYGIEHVIISMAGAGAVYLHPHGACRAVPPKRKAVNSVGAGDSLTAGFIKALKVFQKPEDILAYASAAGSATAFSETFCTEEEVKQLQGEIDITTISNS
ncbi:1-phosphofructokinase [Salibacterium qingdaonense]|uniref:Tagatose-6-phosphate kinase n=1 Tax=Salibacterium qingdaonense TaxID=266892 RepID=A0A1I4MYI9_9BACI|nr:1-phosphofructokinase [Salibacterium qingdaonense]SFM08146.1 1-phosphofructokinase [Salibacterium qingdaonense]